MKRLWEGFSVNDVVILGPKVTKQSYGLDLCDDAGEAILMDGVLVSIEGDFARVRVGRVMGKPAPGRGPMVGELQMVLVAAVLGDNEPTNPLAIQMATLEALKVIYCRQEFVTVAELEMAVSAAFEQLTSKEAVA